MAGEFQLTLCPDPLSSENVGLSAEANAISVFVSSAVPKSLMQRMPKLGFVACRSAGFDKVDLVYARKRDIKVANTPDYGAATVAEYAFLLLLAVARRLMLSAHAARFGGGSPEKLSGTELSGKTLGVIGTGRIGRHVAQLGRGFGMDVIAYDPYPNERAAADIGYRYVSQNEVLAQSDCLSLHAPASGGSAHLLDSQSLTHVKRGVLIFNTARGSLIDTDALIQALQSGKVAGAGLDVLESEELLEHAPPDRAADAARVRRQVDELVKFPGVLITRHNAYNSAEAVARIRVQTTANLRGWQAGNLINLVSAS
ncbi:MAG TPA: NAD(P)-dependent oxidoreductase [Candidatus Saccharimonadia bacterium]|nr:NAD(P)-dependent oxidoreductase [Candidatus Saccharimonadia bacterium]